MMTAIKKYFFLFFLISINAYGSATIAPQCKYNDRIIIQFGKSKPSWDASDKSNYSISGNTIRYAAYDKKKNVSALILNNALMYGQEYTVAANNDSTTFTFYGDSDQAEVSFDGNKFLTDKDINYSWYSSFFLWDSPFGIYGKTNFIGEYTGYVNLAKKYEANVESIDGFRILLNEEVALNRWDSGYQSSKFSKKYPRWERIKIQMYNDGSRPTPLFWFEEYARFKVSAKNVSQCVPSKYKPKVPNVTVIAPDKGSLCSDTIIDVYSDKDYVNISAKYGTFYIHSGKGKIKNNRYYFDKKDKGKVQLKLVNKRQLTDTWFIGDESGKIDFYSTSITLSNINDIAHANNTIEGTYVNYDNGICEVADINEKRNLTFTVSNEKSDGAKMSFDGSLKNYNEQHTLTKNISGGKFQFDIALPSAGLTEIFVVDEEMNGVISAFVRPDTLTIKTKDKMTSGKNESIVLEVTGNGKLVTNYNLISDSVVANYTLANEDMINPGVLKFEVDNSKFVKGVYESILNYDEVGVIDLNITGNYFSENKLIEFIPYRFELINNNFQISYGESDDWKCEFNGHGQSFRTRLSYIELEAKNYEGKTTENYQKSLYSFNKEHEVLNSYNGKRHKFFSFSGGAGSIMIEVPVIVFESPNVNEPTNPSIDNLEFYVLKETLFDNNIKFTNDITFVSDDILFKFVKVVVEDATSSSTMASLPIKFEIYDNGFKPSERCMLFTDATIDNTSPFEVFDDYIEVFSNGNKRSKITLTAPDFLIYKESNIGAATFLQRVRNVFIREVYRDQYK